MPISLFLLFDVDNSHEHPLVDFAPAESLHIQAKKKLSIDSLS